MTNDSLFRSVAPRYMRQFMADFDASDLDAAAVFGNGGLESAGFTTLQEIKPTVAGSKGGWGWFQWTGPRRRAFEAYCKRTGKDPASHDANYAWLFLELKGDEKRAVAKLKEAGTLEAKVIAFENAYERSGVKHYESRQQWARIALDALRNAPPADEPPVASPEPTKTTSPVAASGIGALVMAALAAILKLFGLI